MSETMYAPLIVSFSVFAVLFCLVWVGIALYRNYVAKQAVLVKVRTETMIDPELFGESFSNVPQEKNPGSLIMSLFGKIGNRHAGDQTPKYPILRVKFLQAGIRNREAVQAFWGVKIFLLVVVPLSFYIFRFALVGLTDKFLTIVITAALAFAGFYAPDLWLKLVTSWRKARIARNLPDAIDMLVVCVEAGLGLDAAISRVAEEIRLTSPDLSDELQLYNLEMRAGMARDDALHNLNRRTDLDEIQSLTNLLIQTNKFGTSLAQGLRVYADSFRTKRMMRAEEKAAKLATSLMIPLIFFIFPALFVVIAFPAAIRMYYSFVVAG
jgi:tight adherence protein C